MKTKLCVTTMVFAFLLSTPQGRAASGRPFLVVQLCLRNERNMALFIDAIKSAAQSEHIGYGDRSEVTQKEMTALGISPKYKVINIGWAGTEGVGWSASNIGLSAYQVTVAFWVSGAADPAAAHRFADDVVGALKKNWQVYDVPRGRGAVPLKDCHDK